ncbi:MAG: CBS domain-containing protein [Planctomycetes bacterium]|nr:CBS domain-containing protein [Planctomycetota bacterium]
MDSQAQKISSSAMVSEAAARMKALEVDRLAVVEDNEIIGAITDCDIARAVSAGLNLTTTPVKYAMTLGGTEDHPAEALANAAGTREDG